MLSKKTKTKYSTLFTITPFVKKFPVYSPLSNIVNRNEFITDNDVAHTRIKGYF